MLTFTLELDDPRLDAVIAVLRGTTIPTAAPKATGKRTKAEPAADPLPAPTPDPVVTPPAEPTPPTSPPPVIPGEVTYTDIKALVFKLAITNQVKLAEIAKHFGVPNFKVLPESAYAEAFKMLSEAVNVSAQ